MITVLTQCQFEEKSALLLINYSDSSETDSMSLSGFRPCFKVSGLRERPGHERRLKELQESKFGNLYS